MAADCHLLGVRHHGPGSARRVLAALDALRPEIVLIEGPEDLSPLMQALGDPAMVPPVALLAYQTGAPERASFWPFADFSPELAAARWALANGAGLRLIDLPAATRFALADAAAQEEAPEEGEVIDDAPGEEAVAPSAPDPKERPVDPIGELARAAGYEDPEGWWADVIEASGEDDSSPLAAFEAVAAAMTTLREGAPLSLFEARREACMRLAIRKARAEAEGPVAVVCGAWHVPALAAKIPAKDDRALLKGLPRAKITATWAPWSMRRLASDAGYGAGVPAPGWYAHLWTHGAGPDARALWATRMAAALREGGEEVSTAAAIETVRLSDSLAALRARPAPGFEEMRDAALACMTHGDLHRWARIAAPLLLGETVGAAPADLPLAPLLADLERRRKQAKMKLEALEKPLALDLRSDSGLTRSTLLHQLLALGAPWGRLEDPGGSRGTFRERWTLRWEPEYAVALVENLVHGPTIEQAATGRLIEAMAGEENLAALAGMVRDALGAQLPAAAEEGVRRLSSCAAHSDDCPGLLAALPPLAEALRYGQARAIAPGPLAALLARIGTLAALSLPRAAQELEPEAAAGLHAAIRAAEEALTLAEAGDEVLGLWRDGLSRAAEDSRCAPLVAGLCARLLYEAGRTDAAEAASWLRRALSPAAPAEEAAARFEGFFLGAGVRLVHDAPLRDAVDAWMQSFESLAFEAALPIFRRAFASLAPAERRMLLSRALGGGGESGETMPETGPWAAHLTALTRLLTGGGWRPDPDPAETET